MDPLVTPTFTFSQILPVSVSCLDRITITLARVPYINVGGGLHAKLSFFIAASKSERI